MDRRVFIWVSSFALALLLMGGAAQHSSAAPLELEVFVSEPKEINITSVLVMGPREMMVVSAQGTKSAATRLADLIASKDRTLKYIFLTHPHLDHSQGAGVLLKRFPEAQFIATPEVAALQRRRMPMDDALAAARFGDNAAIPSVPAEDFEATEILIDGQSVEIWKDIVGDPGLGRPDEPHVALYVPSLHALFPSDAVYFDGHVMMGGSTSEQRRKWIAQIDGWIEKKFKIVVPGHMPKGAPATADGALRHTRDYIAAYDRAMAEHDSSEGVIKAMLLAYPDIKHTSALYLGTFINFYELSRISFDPKDKEFPEGLSDQEKKAVDRQRFKKLWSAYNP